MVFFLLNESKHEGAMGDLCFFKSLRDMEQYVEPVDVQNQEYSAFTSDGHAINIALDRGRPKMTIGSEPAKRDVVYVLIRQYLSYLVKLYPQAVTEDMLTKAKDLESIVSCVPPTAFSR